MAVQLELRQLDVPPGHRVRLHEISWDEFERILEELGEHRGTRLAYCRGTLEIVAPLPEHEIAKVMIGDLLKVLMDELDMNWESLGSTTFKREDMTVGIEPDDCFYIANHALMIGRSRLDLTVDPPPDLALEIDLTSTTQLGIYQALGVPEIWRYENRELRIYILEQGEYVESEVSPTFPDVPITEGIARFVEMSRSEGTSPTLRTFRRWVREQIRPT